MRRRARSRTAAVLVSGLVVGGLLAPAPADAIEDRAASLEALDWDTDALPLVSVTVAAPAELVGAALTKSFTVTEDGAPVRDLTVTELRNDRLEIVLVIDTSASMQGWPISEAKAAAEGFVAQVPPSSRLALVGFGNEPAVAAGLTTDMAVLRGALGTLQASGDTAMYDAVVAATSLFSGETGSRRVVVLLTDGGDTASTTSVGDAAASLAAADAQFFAVSLTTPETDLSALGVLAGAVGGRVVAADDAVALSGAYDSVATNLVQQYRLSWEATGRGDTPFTVSLSHGGVERSVTQTLSLPATSPPVEAPTPPTSLTPHPEVAAPTARVAPSDRGLLPGPWMLGIGLTAMFGAFLLLALRFLDRTDHRRPTRSFVRRRDPRSTVDGLVHRATELAERSLESTDMTGRLDTALDRAGIAVRPAEFVVMATTAAVTALLLVTALSSVVVGLAAAVSVLIGFRLVVSHRTTRRRVAFDAQLPDALHLVASSLRAGHGTLQALDAAAHELADPAGAELRRVLAEVRLGRPLPQALDNMRQRVGSTDFGWIVEAMAIHQEVGGDLAEVLDTVAITVRDRLMLARKVNALSAEGKISAEILFALPFLLALWLNVANPDYFDELTATGTGHTLLVAAAALLALGAFWFRQIVRIRP